MTSIKRMGDGFITAKHTEYLNNGDLVDIETIDIDLSGTITSKLSLDNIATYNGAPGQVLMINDYGNAVWTDLPISPDKELRDQYPSLQISWDRVMEAISEYEFVKKLVRDYD